MAKNNKDSAPTPERESPIQFVSFIHAVELPMASREGRLYATSQGFDIDAADGVMRITGKTGVVCVPLSNVKFYR